MTTTASRPRPAWAERLTALPRAPRRLGAHPVPGGVHFAVHAPHARDLRLVLLDRDDGAPLAEVPFPAGSRFGDVHAMVVLGLDPDRAHYGYRAAGGALLLDPHARAVPGGERWGERPRYRCAVRADGADFDWQGVVRPRIPTEDLVIYELHVRGFTRSPSSGVASPGTFAGLRAKIDHLTALGVNCVELLPVFEFDETDNTYSHPDTGEPLRNFWGYNTVAFFAPKAGYAADPSAPAREFKELVRELHRAGIEVVLDVVFNHTAEGDHRGPTLSFRGLDAPAYYLLTPDGAYRNLTATGNTVNANHPVTRAFILDCLRYWAEEFHIDGFRFDMAPILARGPDGALLERPPLLEEIAQDPVLADRRLIAEATDAAGADLLGRFPSYGHWAEWNWRYRDAVRRFLIGRPGSAGELATRLVGSPDLYGSRGPLVSVNHVTCHDGFTLADWAAYDRPRNRDNGEGGTDGIAENHSWNCGVEGPTDDPGVNRLRARQVRNALLLLLVSTGVPMLLAGDEFGRTQHGNNNAYSQDNAVGWVDWDLAERNADLVRFTARCLRFRQAHPALRRPRHPDGITPAGWAYPPVSWHGRRPWEPDWSDGSGLVAALLHHRSPDGAEDTVFVAVNARPDATRIEPPPAPAGSRWHRFADTAAEPGRDAFPVGEEPPLDYPASLVLDGHSAVVLVAHPADPSPERS